MISNTNQPVDKEVYDKNFDEIFRKPSKDNQNNKTD